MSGNTYPFREAVNAHGVGGGYDDNEPDNNRREHFRALGATDVCNEQSANHVIAILTPVVQNMPVRCQARTPPPANTAGQA
eukprot:7869333-Karenia_brevis.AAC.1